MRRLLVIGTTIAAITAAPFVSAQMIAQKARPQLSGFYAAPEFSLVDPASGTSATSIA